MFESAEAGRKLSQEEFEAREPGLRVDLLNAQFDLRTADFPVVILVAGDDRIGCQELVDRVYDWMDARWIELHALAEPTDEERERPWFWRYWRRMPRDGRVGLFLDSWGVEPIRDHLERQLDAADLARRAQHVRATERALVDDGVLLLKFWLHLPKKAHAKRVKKGQRCADGWRVETIDRQIHERYDELMAAAEVYLRDTDDGRAPWRVVESGDAEYRDLTVMEAVRDALVERLRLGAAPAAPSAAPGAVPPLTRGAPLSELDLTLAVPRKRYRERYEEQRARLKALSVRARDAGLSSVVLLEGWDAAGKGSAIRRLTRSMAARDYHVVPIAAPTDEERAHHYLWRFWRRLPRAGQMLILDRSWYGRVLVERVEGYARPEEWRRAYAEIGDFEAQLAEHGLVLSKFWLHIDPEEQLRRFEARKQTPYKKYKLTEEDFRNREKWDAYVEAVEEMVARTSTPHAPWRLVPANDKRHARLEVVASVCEALERGLA